MAIALHLQIKEIKSNGQTFRKIFSSMHKISIYCKPTFIHKWEIFVRFARASSSRIFLAANHPRHMVVITTQVFKGPTRDIKSSRTRLCPVNYEISQIIWSSNKWTLNKVSYINAYIKTILLETCSIYLLFHIAFIIN